ncbi:hypothetical protein Salat_0291700 [Sesamum alatum]|uniref:RNase H type-1 domain-containing protein n=1 Tax=Sesamum alatum TaxID=300844 RepID=A0AAE1Z131_9LAMI|nr:hypothetical protein Salat_0291700 [Sesamum alatum]
MQTISTDTSSHRWTRQYVGMAEELEWELWPKIMRGIELIGLQNSTHAEALAVRGVVELVHRNKWNNVQIECDCRNVIHKIREKKMDDFNVSPILEDTTNLLATVDTWDMCPHEKEGNCVCCSPSCSSSKNQ